MTPVILTEQEECEFWTFIHLKMDIERKYEILTLKLFDEYRWFYGMKYSAEELEAHFYNHMKKNIHLSAISTDLMIYFCYFLHIPLTEGAIERLEKESMRYKLNSDRTIAVVSSKSEQLYPRNPAMEKYKSLQAAAFAMVIGKGPNTIFLVDNFWKFSTDYLIPDEAYPYIADYFKNEVLQHVWCFSFDISLKLGFMQELGIKMSRKHADMLERLGNAMIVLDDENKIRAWRVFSKETSAAQKPTSIDVFCLDHFGWILKRTLDCVKCTCLKEALRENNRIDEDYWKSR